MISIFYNQLGIRQSGDCKRQTPDFLPFIKPKKRTSRFKLHTACSDTETPVMFAPSLLHATPSSETAFTHNPGIRPSLSMVSSLAISAKLLALLIIALNLSFSSSVNLTLLPPFTPFVSATGAYALLLLCAVMLCANSVGSARVPKSSLARERSASRTRAKSRKRTEGRRWIV